MISEEDIEQMKKPSLWGEHNRALKHPEYQMEGMLDCLREEMMMNMPVYPEPIYQERQLEESWTNRQWDYVQQLKADQVNLRKTLYDTLKEIKERANASKRKTTDTNKLNNIYKGIGSGNENAE